LPPSRSSAEALLRRVWRRRGTGALFLYPVSIVFASLVALRRALYRLGILRDESLPVPVVVVGNISVGGSGKTPLVLHLARALRAAGARPAIVSRGYRSDADGVREVGPTDDPGRVGDEPLLLRQRSDCPVFVGADRVAACRAVLAAHPDTSLILSDDGLQHYRLRRRIEIAVVDVPALGNRLPLPSGPLREPASRLDEVDAVVMMLEAEGAVPPRLTFRAPTFVARRRPGEFRDLAGKGLTPGPAELRSARWHAVAGIAEPERFFAQLAAAGIAFEAHAFGDHHAYRAEELRFAGDGILTTEKDAVKLARLDLALPVWVLPLELDVVPDLARHLLEMLKNGRAPA